MRIPFTDIHVGVRRKQRIEFGRIFNASVVRIMGADQQEYIKNAYEINPNVYAAVNLITKAVARAEFQLFKTKRGSKHKYANQHMRRKAAEVEEIEEHDIFSLLNRPNPNQGKTEFLENLIGYKLITGESFIHKVILEEGANRGTPAELWLLPPPHVAIKRDQWGVPVQYRLRAGGTEARIEADEVIHLKYWNPDNSGRGMSPIKAGRYAVTQNNDSFKSAMRMLQNSGAVGIMSVGGEEDSYDEEEMQRLDEKYMEKYGGAENRGRIMFVNEKVSWQQIGLSAVDLALIEANKMSMRDICNLFNISSQLLNDPDNKTYSNMVEAVKSLIRNAVIPELKLVVHEFNRSLIPHYEQRDNADYFLDVDQSVYDELNEDMRDIIDALKSAYFLTPDEQREIFSNSTGRMLDDIDNDLARQLWFPTNLMPVGMITDDGQ